jgi:glycosyltransferase involved in cell wall biosynthesis
MISVIVCTYNRSQTLHRMLESFFSQPDLNHLDHEIIVVDNNSADDTTQVAKEFSNKPGFFYILEGRQGLSFARNRGIAEATGDFVSFLDDDVIVDPRWLVNLQKCLDETHADVVGGKVELNYLTPPPSWLGPQFRMQLAELDLSPTRLFGLDSSGYSGCNITFRKQALQDAGRFNERLGRTGTQLECLEETVVLYRIKSDGGKLVYDPTVRVEHLVGPERMTWPYFKRLFLGQGISLARLEIDGEVMSHLITLISRLGLERVFKNFLDSHRKPTRIVLVERHSPPSKWLKLTLIDLAFLAAAVFKLLLIYVSSGDSYSRKAGQASILTAASRVLHRWKNLWNSVVSSST